MITIQQLITIAPFSEEVKTELLSKVDSMDDAKKLELTNTCWMVISEWYENEIAHKQKMAMLEMAEGKKEYTKEDLAKIPDDIFSELTHKLQEVATKENLEEVREKLDDLTEKSQQTQQ